MNERDKEIEEIESGNAWLDTDEIVETEIVTKRPLEKVVPVRLPADVWNELRTEARALGIGPSTLLRMWTMEKLRTVRKEQQSA